MPSIKSRLSPKSSGSQHSDSDTNIISIPPTRRHKYHKLTKEKTYGHLIAIILLSLCYIYFFFTIPGQDTVLNLIDHSISQTSPMVHRELYTIRDTPLAYANPMSYVTHDPETTIEWEWASKEPTDLIANQFYYTRARRRQFKYLVVFNMHYKKTINDMMKMNLLNLQYSEYHIFMVNIPLDHLGNIAKLDPEISYKFIETVLKTLKLYHILPQVAILGGTKSMCPIYDAIMHAPNQHVEKILALNSINCQNMHSNAKAMNTPIYFFDNFGGEQTHFSYIQENELLNYVNITGQLEGAENTKMWMYTAGDKFRYLVEEVLADKDLNTLDLRKALVNNSASTTEGEVDSQNGSTLKRRK